MREIMIGCIKSYYWLDYSFENRGLPQNPESYSEYLSGLDDDDLLYTYDRVKEAINNLD